jgi:hypothetical protein
VLKVSKIVGRELKSGNMISKDAPIMRVEYGGWEGRTGVGEGAEVVWEHLDLQSSHSSPEALSNTPLTITYYNNDKPIAKGTLPNLLLPSSTPNSDVDVQISLLHIKTGEPAGRVTLTLNVGAPREGEDSVCVCVCVYVFMCVCMYVCVYVWLCYTTIRLLYCYTLLHCYTLTLSHYTLTLLHNTVIDVGDNTATLILTTIIQLHYNNYNTNTPTYTHTHIHTYTVLDVCELAARVEEGEMPTYETAVLLITSVKAEVRVCVCVCMYVCMCMCV